MNSLTDVDNFDAPVTCIADGDVMNSANFTPPAQALSNRTRNLKNRVDGLRAFATKTTTYSVLTTDAVLVSLTDGQIFNLPSAASAGNMHLTFINTAADAAALLKIQPNGTDSIQGQVAAVESGGVNSKGWWNTKATHKKGDHTTIVCDGVSKWWITGGVGVWASEP